MDTRHTLELEGVSHAFGRIKAVAAVSLGMTGGEVVCLVGPSGCGKTTLLRIAAGLERLQQGCVRIDGAVVADAKTMVPPEHRGVGLLFQDYALFPHLTVAANVRFGLRRLPARERDTRVNDVLRTVGMLDYAAAYPHTLSGGQQQRVALARALAPAPKLMLLDEPFSGLDVQLREQVRDQALHILKASGAATLLVTHDPEEAMFMADRVAVMRAGAIEQVGVPAEIYSRPCCAFVAEFFSEVNRMVGVVRDDAAETPLGRFETDGLEDGTPVEILVRPEGIRVTAVPQDGPWPWPGPTARVIASRMLGRSSLIHLSAAGADGKDFHFHSRMPGTVLPREDETVAVELDTKQTFVFPAKRPK